MKYVETVDSSLIRDINSRALITEDEGVRQAFRQKNKERARLATVESELQTIKTMLQDLLDRN